MTASQVDKLADRLLAESEMLLEAGWFGDPLTHNVTGLRELAEYPCLRARLRTDGEFAERFELVVQAWKDRPSA